MKSLHPTAFVVFGATGDLTQNKLYPALYELALRGGLPKKFYIYGIARDKVSNAQFKQEIKNSITGHAKPLDKKALSGLLKNVKYISVDLKDVAGYLELEDQIKKEEVRIGHGILRVFYLALPPSIFPYVAKNVEACRIGKHLCTKEKILSRIIVEKPFGNDLGSAKKLDKRIREVFKDEQIYRIDHYLGKEPFQNILMFRFGNQFFEKHWNAKHISQIQINALETVGTEGRFSYYDGAGATRDMVQSHLMQFLAYLTMDEPPSLSSKGLQKAKGDVLQFVRPFGGRISAVKGQYLGYRSEKGVKKNSMTDTYVAMKLEINTPRWKGVPIYVRTGKFLDRKETSALIEFKGRSSRFMTDSKHPLKPNIVSLNISPTPSVSMSINVHKPGIDMGADSATMHYCRGEKYGSEPEVGDYARLLIDVIRGDQSLFTSSKEIFSSWKVVDQYIKRGGQKLHKYKPGSSGPKAADDMLKSGGHKWLLPVTDCPI